MTALPLDERPARLESVDALRGVIMVIMALDHTRDYFGSAAANPTDLATASAALFLTRWITHICAPTFFLLSGVGAHLSSRRRSRADLSTFLATRGLWFVLLEWTVMRFILQFNVDYKVTILTVLWAFGWSMLVLAALVWLPRWAIAAFGLALVLFHNLLDGRGGMGGGGGPLMAVLHGPGVLYASPAHFVLAAYALVPWAGVMALGYSLGPVLSWTPERRQRFLVRLGGACIAAFIVLRLVNRYGDPAPWSAQPRAGFTVLSFLNTTKYPPSLLFLLMTLGPALVGLALLDRGVPRALRWVLWYGRVPLFYFLLHFLMIHLLATGASLARYGTARFVVESPTPAQYPFTQPPGWPAPLPVIYLVWALVVLLAYPFCRWYATVKGAQRHPLLSYL